MTTRSLNTSHPLPQKIALSPPPWPQIGTVLSESDIPAAWRETSEMRELRNQYFALGAVGSIFLVGIVMVLAFGWARYVLSLVCASAATGFARGFCYGVV